MEQASKPVKKLVEKLKITETEWRGSLDREVEQEIEKILKRIKPYEDAYTAAKNPAVAQLWVAVGELQAKIDAMDAKLERLLAEKPKRERKRIKDEELRRSAENY